MKVQESYLSDIFLLIGNIIDKCSRPLSKENPEKSKEIRSYKERELMELIESLVKMNPKKVMGLLMGYLNVGEVPTRTILRIMTYISKKHQSHILPHVNDMLSKLLPCVKAIETAENK